MAKKEAQHGGSWKVAYADFVTAMMALFLCLWLTSQDQKIKDAVERAFRNPFSSVTKESVGLIPNKEASSTYRQQGRFSSMADAVRESLQVSRALQSQAEQGFSELVVRNPQTGEERVIVIPNLQPSSK